MGECQQVALGQPVGDGSLNTQVNTSGSFFNITGGQQAGPNLFHSFQSFDIPAGNTAQFLPAATVEAIFGRITGSAPSRISGQVGVSGDANLFLLNPNGFVFEAGSSLSLNGDFTLATADSVRFANGDRFLASLSQPSLLSISVPVGLGNIVANSRIENHSNLTNNGGDITIAAGLIAGAGELRSISSIQLTSQDSIKQGRLIAPMISADAQGNISFLALSAPSSISIAAGKDLQVVQGIKTLGTSGDAGSVALKAEGNISIEDTIDSRSTAPMGDAGSVEIRAGGDIRLTEIQAYVGPSTRGDSGDVAVESGGTLMMVDGAIATFNGVDGVGNGGDIRLEARDILLTGTRLQSSNLGEGNGGNIELQAQDRIQLRSSSTNLAQVLSQSNAGSQGDSGNILLQAGRIELVDALVDAQMKGVGRGGDIILRARNPLPLGQENQIKLAGDRAKSELMSRLTGQGQAGDIRLETPKLLLADNARISSVTEGQGNAGTIAIQTRSLELEGNSIIETGNNRRTARGDGGLLSIETEQLSLKTGGRLQSASQGLGDAGDILIKASEFITLDGDNPSGPASSLKASVTTSGQGQAGRIVIQTEDLNLNNGAQVQSNGENAGAFPGQIDIAAEHVLLVNGVRLSADVRNSATGDGGTVSISAEGSVRATGNSDITTQTRGGDLGLIMLKAQAIDGLQPRDRLTSDNDLLGKVEIEILPDSPALPIEPPEIPTIEPTFPEGPSPGLPIEPGKPTEPGEPTLPGETTTTPERPLSAPANPLSESKPKPSSKPRPFMVILPGPGPSVPMLIPSEVLAPAIDAVSSQSLAKQEESNQNLQLQVEAVLRQDSGLAVPQFLSCRDSDATLRLVGRGGLSDSAHQVLPGRSLWLDSRALSSVKADLSLNASDAEAGVAKQARLQEATTWQWNGDRQVQLLAEQGLASRQGNCAELSLGSEQ